MASRVEQARDNIASSLAGITMANGYRTNVANVSKAIVHPDIVSEWPHLCVELGKSTLQAKDSGWTIFDELTEVFIVGFVRSDTETTVDISSISELQDVMESLIHDLKKKICTDLLTTYVHALNNEWIVSLTDNRLDFVRTTMLGGGRNIGIVETNLMVRVRHQGLSFEDEIELLTESGDYLVTESGDFIISG